MSMVAVAVVMVAPVSVVAMGTWYTLYRRFATQLGSGRGISLGSGRAGILRLRRGAATGRVVSSILSR